MWHVAAGSATYALWPNCYPAAMSHRLEALPWDTDFFGVPIARVELDGLGADDLAAIETEARDRGFDCVYGSLDPNREPALAHHVQDAGHRLVEVSVTLARTTTAPLDLPDALPAVRRGTLDDLPLLDKALDLLAPWSRFAADSRFGPAAARRMYDAWVRRAAADEDDEFMLLIAEDASGVTGVATHVRADQPRVDLMAVTKPGTRTSWALLAGGIEWGGTDAFHAGPVAARNVAPLRFLERHRFEVFRTRYLFHRWFDDEPAGSGSA